MDRANPAAAAMLINRVRKNARHLRKWARRESVTCYRLYDRDIPEVPLAIDWYQEDPSSEPRLHIAEYQRRTEHPPGWIDHMATAVATALEVEPEHVYVKRRQRQRGAAQYQRHARTGERFTVREGGHRFWVNLADYLDTGLFLDHRPTRALVQREAAGKRFLNLFCYTGSFTVYAAAGGARESVSVDLSNTYLGWARDNFELAGLDLDRHRLIQADVMAALPHSRGGYQLAVVDPPTFSNSKRMERSFDVLRDHVELLESVRRAMVPGGVIYFSTNARRFKLDGDALRGLAVEDVTAATIDPDFRDPRIHRCYRLTVERS